VIVTDMSDEEYHRRPELSSTGARKLLESPAKFAYAQTHPQPHKQAFDVGHAVHARVLGVGSPVEVLDYDSYRTKAAQDARDAAYMAGLVPMLAKDMGPINGMAEAVLAHPDARAVLEALPGREVSIFADVDGVPTRARFDIYGERAGADLKTALDASPDGFNRAVDAYGLHVQAAWYGAAHRAVTGRELESFHFLAVEKTAPYLVGVYDLDIMWRDIGREQATKARELWLRCTETGRWPGYAATTLSCPTYVVYRHDEASGMYEEIQV
jgi:hypothetical protein